MLVSALLSTIGLVIVSICLLRPAMGLKLVVMIALIGTGSVLYFLPQFYKLAWVVSIGGFSLLLPALLASMTDRIRPNTGILLAMSVFGFMVIISTANNLQYPGEILAAMKNMFPFWSVPVLAYSGLIRERDNEAIMRLIFWAAVLQIPVSLFQFFYVVDWGTRTAGGDSVVGTFGGDPEGGGSSGAQTTYLVIVWSAIMTLYLGGAINKTKYVVGSFALLLPALLNETKVVFVYLAVASFFMVKSSIRQHTSRAVMIFLLTSVAAAGILFFYFTSLQHGTKQYEAHTINEYVEKKVMSRSGVKLESEHGMSRLGSVVYWWEQNSLSKDPLNFLFGHGLGASKYAGIVNGHLYKQPQYASSNLGLTSLSSLLWDVGMFGAVSFLAIFLMAMRCAIILRKNYKLDKQQRALLLGIQIALAIFILGLLYGTHLIENQALNAFSMCCLAYVIYLRRIVKKSTNK